ncbi:hypothetical protein T11_17655 [Trichinella zimbabwensis]|uniref:Uncharacterized protein n=1 Tax=Trichinella zimbabwensis TaxID=268475 RepID=A0A0V1GXZ4_9BILA|nr:hypothetical protein T11_17655 [Trichinella zimbabwensis]
MKIIRTVSEPASQPASQSVSQSVSHAISKVILQCHTHGDDDDGGGRDIDISKMLNLYASVIE